MDNGGRIAGTVGTLMIDAWTQRGMIAADFFPLSYGLRPEKPTHHLALAERIKYPSIKVDRSGSQAIISVIEIHTQ